MLKLSTLGLITLLCYPNLARSQSVDSTEQLALASFVGWDGDNHETACVQFIFLETAPL